MICQSIRCYQLTNKVIWVEEVIVPDLEGKHGVDMDLGFCQAVEVGLEGMSKKHENMLVSKFSCNRHNVKALQHTFPPILPMFNMKYILVEHTCAHVLHVL